MIQGTLKKIKDTGSNDPFNARMMFGIMKLRDYIVKNEEERLTFDKFYQPILSNLDETQEHMKTCLTLIETHLNKISSGQLISFQRKIIEVKETIDNQLNKNFKDFFIKGGIATKALSPLSKHLGYSLSFFFQKNEKNYQQGKEKFLTLNQGKKFKELIEMLDRDRNEWYIKFIQIRNKIEHEGFSLPDIKYTKVEDGSVIPLLPKINGNSITNFLLVAWDNLFEFVEDIIVSLISFNLKPPLVIVAIPEQQRDKSLPLKYKIWTEGLTEFLQKKQKNEK